MHGCYGYVNGLPGDTHAFYKHDTVSRCMSTKHDQPHQPHRGWRFLGMGKDEMMTLDEQ